MSKSFSVVTPKSSSLQLKIDSRQNDDGKWRVFLKETDADGKSLPVRIASLDKYLDGDKGFMVIRAPLRVQNEDGSFQTRARQKDGKFLDVDGKEVDSEDKAAREYVLMTYRNEPNKLVYGQIATVNVKNKKVDGTPTAMTLLTFKLYSDKEALEAERQHHKLKSIGVEHADYAAGQAELKRLRREDGVWADFFIASGHDVLREMGWDIRELAKKANSAEDSPAP